MYIIFPTAGQAIRYAVRIASDRCLAEARLIRGNRKRQTARGYGSCGMNGCSGTSWSEKLDGKKPHGVAWWQVRSGVERIRFFLHTGRSQHNSHEPLEMGYYILILTGLVSFHGPLCCCAVPYIYFPLFPLELCLCYMNESSGIR